MRKKKRILAAALCALGTLGNFALFGDEAATGTRPLVVAPRNGVLEKPTGRKAFLVAADNYGDAATALPCTKNDANALKARLEELGFETVVLETGGNIQSWPTKTMIERRFKEFVANLRSGDFAIVYLSGHGVQPANSDESFFAPVDVDLNNLFDSSVSIDKMLAALEASDATFRWAIVDACRDDPTNSEDDGDAPAFKGASKSLGAKALGDIANVPKSVALLQSCQPGRRSYEGGGPGAEEIKNGFFTLSLLEALDENESKADANGDGVLTFAETFEYVTRRTDELARKSYGVSQVPNLTGSITNFALLDELLRDGINKSKWNEANGLYQEACVLRRQKKWSEALAKIKAAREINEKREEYKTAESEVQALVDAEADALYLAAENAFLAGDLTTAKSKCEALLETSKADAARNLLKRINDKIAETSRPSQPVTAQNAGTSDSPSPSSVRAPRWKDGVGYVAADEYESDEPSSGGGALDSQRRYAGGSTGGTSTRPSSSSGGWSGNYAAGTSRSLQIKGETYDFRYCPAGTFTMGSPESEPDRLPLETQHEVTLTRGFWMLETEVTQAMWESVTGKNPVSIDSYKGPKKPVGNVTWDDCQDFIEKLNSGGYAPSGFEFRLPTEAEWEYACRAGTTGPYAGSSLDSLGWYEDNSDGDNHDVAQKKPNAWGLYDMHGNVWEWCADWFDFDTYDVASQTDPTGPSSGSFRVLRGGSWGIEARNCRSAHRYGNDPTIRDILSGFRLVLGLSALK